MYAVCEIVQPCNTQCLAQEMGNDKNFVQNKHVEPPAQDFFLPFGTLQ